MLSLLVGVLFATNTRRRITRIEIGPQIRRKLTTEDEPPKTDSDAKSQTNSDTKTQDTPANDKKTTGDAPENQEEHQEPKNNEYKLSGDFFNILQKAQIK